MERKFVDEYHCHGMIIDVKSKIETLENSFNHDHKRLEEDHKKLERTIENVKKHNEDQDERARQIKEKMKELEILTNQCHSASSESVKERKELNATLSQVVNDVNLIKQDMGRMADNKKTTIQHIMSIVGPIITAALILWLGLS